MCKNSSIERVVHKKIEAKDNVSLELELKRKDVLMLKKIILVPFEDKKLSISGKELKMAKKDIREHLKENALIWENGVFINQMKTKD